MSSRAALHWRFRALVLKRCPIAFCRYSGKTRDSFFSHLFRKHHKSEIIAALLDLLGL